MVELAPTFLFFQMLGALLGASMVVWGEFAYIHALKDGKIDSAEQAYLHKIGNGLRFGMTLFLFASVGLVVVAFLLHTEVQPAQTTLYWVLTALSILTIATSWMLSRHRISFLLGSAIIFTSWWFLAYLVLGLVSMLSFGIAVAFFVIATAIFYAVFGYTRFLAQMATKF